MHVLVIVERNDFINHFGEGEVRPLTCAPGHPQIFQGLLSMKVGWTSCKGSALPVMYSVWGGVALSSQKGDSASSGALGNMRLEELIAHSRQWSGCWTPAMCRKCRIRNSPSQMPTALGKKC